MLSQKYLKLLGEGLDTVIERCFTTMEAAPEVSGIQKIDTNGLFSISHCCEAMLPSDPQFGNDIVKGRYHNEVADGVYRNGKPLNRLWSLYMNTLTWQGLKMFASILRLGGEPENVARADEVEQQANSLEDAILRNFLQPDGTLISEIVEYDDGTVDAIEFKSGEMWETNWSLAKMPPL